MNNSSANLFIIGLMVTLIGCGTPVEMKESPDPASLIKDTANYSSRNLPDLSMDEFERLKKGMTYEQVTEIVGSTGEIVVETGNPDDQLYTVTYQFKGEGNLWGTAKAQLVFQGGKLTTKTQMGIKKYEYKEI